MITATQIAALWLESNQDTQALHGQAQQAHKDGSWPLVESIYRCALATHDIQHRARALLLTWQCVQANDEAFDPPGAAA